MPGRDGTGPVGMGPMTGRGMGYCGHHVHTPWAGRRFWGCGRGFYPYTGYGVPQGPAQEKDRLADMEKALSEQLAEVRRMQADLDAPDTE